MSPKKEEKNKIPCFQVLNVLFCLGAEALFCSLDVLSGGQGIGKLKFLIRKI
jgi:hypothetical protein